jgi:hypothetical protein
MTKSKLNIGIGEEVDYDGSKVFAGVADALGLSVDLVRVNFHVVP